MFSFMGSRPYRNPDILLAKHGFTFLLRRYCAYLVVPEMVPLLLIVILPIQKRCYVKKELTWFLEVNLNSALSQAEHLLAEIENELKRLDE
jgi:hypothetical protein